VSHFTVNNTMLENACFNVAFYIRDCKVPFYFIRQWMSESQQLVIKIKVEISENCI